MEETRHRGKQKGERQGYGREWQITNTSINYHAKNQHIDQLPSKLQSSLLSTDMKISSSIHSTKEITKRPPVIRTFPVGAQ